MGSSLRHTMSADFTETDFYGVHENSDDGLVSVMTLTKQPKDRLTAELLWPGHGALGQHICKHKPERFYLQAKTISL